MKICLHVTIHVQPAFTHVHAFVCFQAWYWGALISHVTRSRRSVLLLSTYECSVLLLSVCKNAACCYCLCVQMQRVVIVCVYECSVLLLSV
jgi:hypothetical protein